MRLDFIHFKSHLGLPREPGVYLVYSGEVILYVGGTRNLRERWLDHKRRGEFLRAGADKIGFCVLEDWRRVERELQWKLLPLLNREPFLGINRYLPPKTGYLKWLDGKVQLMAG